MNAPEGLRRIALVIRWVGCLIGIPIAVIAMFGLGQGRNDEAGFFIAVGALIAVMGWVMAWIVEGFAKRKV